LDPDLHPDLDLAKMLDPDLPQSGSGSYIQIQMQENQEKKELFSTFKKLQKL
jgi:hypothetical protein